MRQTRKKNLSWVRQSFIHENRLWKMERDKIAMHSYEYNIEQLLLSQAVTVDAA